MTKPVFGTVPNVSWDADQSMGAAAGFLGSALTLVHSFFLRQLWICTVGVRTLLLPLSCNLTAKTDSPSVKVHTSTLFNLTNTTHTPDAGINVYSFALRPEEHQPSGSCNFSRIDNATLQLVLSSATVGGTATAKVRVYATNYNVLRVMSGLIVTKCKLQMTSKFIFSHQKKETPM